MPQINLVVRHEAGLHARPLAAFVKTARAFDADITVKNVTTGAGPANGKSLLALLLLSVQQGHQISVVANGSDENEALIKLRNLVENNFE